MIEIKQVLKKEIPDVLQNPEYWNGSFLPVSKHRLYAHYKNPTCDDDDVVLLLGYLNDELVGYMGVFIDKIKLDGHEQKIGWLSTWWVHPKTKGTGIGRKILNTMYGVQGGKIGISQFTPSAKRVYDKSGYFVTLKESKGIKGVLRSNLSFVIPIVLPKLSKFRGLLVKADHFFDVFVNVKISLQRFGVRKRVNSCQLEYLNILDPEAIDLIEKYGKSHISPKGAAFFEWLKAYHWVQDAPLLSNTQKDKYAFSMVDRSFSVYLIKVIKQNKPIGFIVLQKRHRTMKVLFAYYDQGQYSKELADIVKLHCIDQNIREVICYDPGICFQIQRSWLFLYKTKKNKQSIISKTFGKTNFDDVFMNFGDGDCSFA
ncbi:GNAT family N-acetyltransferase [Aquimarina algicola]|uniref:GNAT family N-acetyltransferase n=1 Tax=Aquimarina algicola TaxID=2589995 RepID=A0A504JI50_9FLAO|nr:GNAT family N-acetyltransferase [Aquimarina algicola]TPN86151.1 GNAT family N-acetyltransferase [Aquimarina algicola]